jgi:mono/diheme cytochrome c family protein
MNKIFLALAAGGGLALTIAACAPEAKQTGAALDFAENCTACHGPAGRGNGPVAVGMTPPPSDLTMLSQENEGVFPKARVMGQLVGYTMGRSDTHMPVFEELRSGPVVMFDDGSGDPVATPARLVAMADYIQTLQK